MRSLFWEVHRFAHYNKTLQKNKCWAFDGVVGAWFVFFFFKKNFYSRRPLVHLRLFPSACTNQQLDQPSPRFWGYCSIHALGVCRLLPQLSRLAQPLAGAARCALLRNTRLANRDLKETSVCKVRVLSQRDLNFYRPCSSKVHNRTNTPVLSVEHSNANASEEEKALENQKTNSLAHDSQRNS